MPTKTCYINNLKEKHIVIYREVTTIWKRKIQGGLNYFSKTQEDVFGHNS